ARVFHKGSASLGGKLSDLSLFYSERNHLWFLAKNFPMITLLKAVPGLIGIQLYRILLMTLRGQAGVMLSANWQSLRGLPRMLRKRREILGRSVLSRRQFEAVLRPSWLLDRWMLSRNPR